MTLTQPDTRAMELALEIFLALGNYKMVADETHGHKDNMMLLNAERPRNTETYNRELGSDPTRATYQEQWSSSFTLLHNALYKYFKRLAVIFWFSKLFERMRHISTGKLEWSEGIDKSSLFVAENRLKKLRAFLEYHQSDISKKLDRPLNSKQSSFRVNKDPKSSKSVVIDQKISQFVAGVCDTINKELEGPKIKQDEMTDQELLSRSSFYSLLDRTIQVIDLFNILSNHLSRFPTDYRQENQQLSSLTFSEFVLNPMAADVMNKFLITMMMKSEEGFAESLSSLLKANCSMFISSNDALFASAFSR